MARRKVATDTPVNGRTRGQTAALPPKANRRMAELIAQENALKQSAGKSVIRKIVLPLPRYEAFLELAKRHGETLSNVLRACAEYGYQHYARFAAADGGISPFTAGYIALMGHDQRGFPPGRPPSHKIDPVGGAFPPAPMYEHAFAETARELPGAFRTTYSEIVEPQFSAPPRTTVVAPSRSLAGLLPSADTVPQHQDEPEPTPVAEQPEGAMTLGFEAPVEQPTE